MRVVTGTGPARGTVVTLLVVSLLTGAGLFFVVEHATWNIAQQNRNEVRQAVVSELVFESLYAAMRAGGGADVLHNTILRLEERLRDHSLYIVRGEALVREYGDLAHSGHFRDEPDVSRALREGIGSNEWRAEGMHRSLIPVRFRGSCLECHKQAVAGDVAAVIVTERLADQQGHGLLDSTLLIYLYVMIAVPLLLYTAFRLGTANRGKR